MQRSGFLHCLLIWLLMCIPANLVYAETFRIKRVAGQESEELTAEILKLALSKVGIFAEFNHSNEDYNNARLMSEVESGKLDIVWMGAEQDAEERLLPIRIPIFQGMLGHRIFIIRAGDQARFDTIRTLEDLKKFDAGQGLFWGDTKALKAAGIPTVTTIKYPNLFPMLEGGRFDYFPRGIHEPWSEVETHADLNLVVEKHVMLVYPFALYFYVSRSNQELHDQIYRGFEMAIEDGSFAQLFFSNRLIKSILDQANLSQRVIIRIDNPYMNPETPFDRKEFWLDVENLK